ncbi:MAG TPA: hypothetical protein VLK82_12765 [Candidatus Tectomicrobia bacterium]|nr:hypothetical protein [Candidatus Tectomicrobia bacterium]
MLILGTSGRASRQFTIILPDMSLAEAIETTRFHRVAGLTGNRTAFVTTGAAPPISDVA